MQESSNNGVFCDLSLEENMKIDVYAAYNHILDKDIKDKVIIVLDTLRATTSIITAMKNGCKEIIPVDDINDALEVSKTMGSHTLLAGERDSSIIPGFDMGNSPLEFMPDKVKGKSIVMTTTNGTEAMLKASSARVVFIGALINGEAVAHEAIKQRRDLKLLCAGNDRKLALEDILTAGAIIDEISAKSNAKLELDDLATISLNLYRQHRWDLVGALRGSAHYEALVSKGFERDVEYCCNMNIMDVVPTLKDGVITV